jgi:hypothetical protein
VPQWPQRHLRAPAGLVVQLLSVSGSTWYIFGGIEEFAFPISGLSEHDVNRVVPNRYAEEASFFP